MWKPPIVCHGTWHMVHNYSQRNTIFDTYATPMTKAQRQLDCSLPPIHLLCKISFWLSIAMRSQSWLLDNSLHWKSPSLCLIHCHWEGQFRRIEARTLCISATPPSNLPAAQKWMIILGSLRCYISIEMRKKWESIRRISLWDTFKKREKKLFFPNHFLPSYLWCLTVINQSSHWDGTNGIGFLFFPSLFFSYSN